jgi:hypothetical protein
MPPKNLAVVTRQFLFGTLAAALLAAPALAADEARWWRGNLHTHSLWSDGDDYPEMVADWYKQHGYNFLALSDHNIMAEGPRWLELKAAAAIPGEIRVRGGGAVLEKYLARFGPSWVEQRETGGKHEVRLKPLAEYRTLFEEPGKFLMIPSFELTSEWKREATAGQPELKGPVHINITNPRERFKPIRADNAVAIMQQSVDALAAQREQTGQPMFAHINHPNFIWGITPEELMQVKGERFFEVYNGHASVHNAGDAAHVSMDKYWDIILARRLSELGLDVMYGVAVDDSHHYHAFGIGKSNSGRGWVMVRATHLTPASMILAMEAGDFYSSSGVTLTEVQRGPQTLAVTIAAQPGVTYTTQFIGTRKGFDARSELLPPVPGVATTSLPHRRYSAEVGAVLAEVKGPAASYTLKGDELYVRAKIFSSKPLENSGVGGEFETAWTQPLVNPAH